MHPLVLCRRPACSRSIASRILRLLPAALGKAPSRTFEVAAYSGHALGPRRTLGSLEAAQRHCDVSYGHSVNGQSVRCIASARLAGSSFMPPIDASYTAVGLVA